MATCKAVFDSAMALIDEIGDGGETITTDTEEYVRRTPYILNVLVQETYPFSDTYVVSEDSRRSVAPIITDFETGEIDQDDFICYSVLPYGLAAHLCLDDNPSVASFCQQRYEEMLIKLRNTGRQSVSEDIYDVYSSNGKGNGIGFEWTTRW